MKIRVMVGEIFSKQNWLFVIIIFNLFLQHLSKRKIFRMSNNFSQRLTTLKETFIYQLPSTRDDFPSKISFKKHFRQDFKGVSKKIVHSERTYRCLMKYYSLIEVYISNSSILLISQEPSFLWRMAVGGWWGVRGSLKWAVLLTKSTLLFAPDPAVL